MFEKPKDLPEATTVNSVVTANSAESYEQNRFQKRRRTRHIDSIEKLFAEHVFNLVGREAASVADIPCGSGRFYEVFRDAKQLTLGDYSENMLNTVISRIGNPSNVRALQCEISAIPLEANSVDLFFCMRLFHHFQSDSARLNALNELARVSRRYVAMSFYCTDSIYYYWKYRIYCYSCRLLRKTKTHVNYVSIAHMIQLARRAGLECVECYPNKKRTGKQCLIVFEVVSDK